jgi:hypothetical protein
MAFDWTNYLKLAEELAARRFQTDLAALPVRFPRP